MEIEKEKKESISIPAEDWNHIRKGIYSGIIVWLFASISTGVIFFFSMSNFREQQTIKNQELVEQINKISEEMKTKVSQKDLENYTSAVKVQLNSINSAVENNNRQQDNMFNYLLNKPSR